MFRNAGFLDDITDVGDFLEERTMSPLERRQRSIGQRNPDMESFFKGKYVDGKWYQGPGLRLGMDSIPIKTGAAHCEQYARLIDENDTLNSQPKRELVAE